VGHIHGKNAVIYLGAAGAAAINVGEQVDWSIDFDMALVDVSPLNTTWKQFVKGLLGYSGSFSGNFDTASTQLWLASLSTVAEKFYLYPDSGSTGRYYYGTVWVQLTKVAAGSTTSKASSGFKVTGDGTLSTN
jgi:hypothetical protein